MTRKVLVAVCASAGLLWSTAFAGSVMVPGIGGDFRLTVKSFESRRFDSVLRQQYDFSCGSAAVASLLSFHYEDQVTEHEVFIDMLALADEEKVRGITWCRAVPMRVLFSHCRSRRSCSSSC